MFGTACLHHFSWRRRRRVEHGLVGDEICIKLRMTSIIIVIEYAFLDQGFVEAR